ncbi:hypothetical protein VTN00DRAFT_5479 [Thermoascus crustaceus]|uniref:uncharacterized protein n=1 Tax=Thermoascus crustaceus TaxID=5088 RepID=UPI0037444273
MAFREKVRRAFRRSGSSKDNGKPKIEYYRRSEVPRSKYRGPFDPEHQRKLAAWSFAGAMADRPRSLDLELSPCASIVGPPEEETAEIQSPDADEGATVDPIDDSIAVSYEDDDELRQGRPVDVGSQTSTAVDTDSHSSSMFTLRTDGLEPFDTTKRDSIAELKETIRYTSPVAQSMSPIPEKQHVPFSPEDLTRALNAALVFT